MLKSKKRVVSDSNDVWLADGLIHIKLAGKQDAAVSEETYQKFVALLNESHAKHHKVFALVDARELQVADLTSSARLKMKEALELSFGGIAVVGKSHLLQIAMYLIKSSSSSKRVRYFVSESKAKHWLQHIQHHDDKRLDAAATVATAAVGAIGVAALLGWATNSMQLTSFVPYLVPLNPIAALGLIILACGLYSSLRASWRFSMLAGCAVATLGIFALLPLHPSYAPLGAHLRAALPHDSVSISGGVGFLCAGIYLLLTRMQSGLVRTARLTLSLVLLCLALFNLFSIMYAQDFVYQLGVSFSMAFNLALAFIFAACIMIYHWFDEQQRVVFGEISRIGWLVAVVLIFMQIATFSLWQQSIARNEATSMQAFNTRSRDVRQAIENRIKAYTDAQQGFRGLYAANVAVNQAQFEKYYKTINLQDTYPGLRALTLISKVSDEELPDFTAQRRLDNSLGVNANTNFKIINQSAHGPHYIVTYYPTSNAYASLGTDLGADPTRVRAFSRAEATDAPIASETIRIAATAAQPSSDGFFIAMPIHTINAKGQPAVGFVNVVFNYPGFFTGVIGTTDILKSLDATVTDKSSKNPVFQQRINQLDPAALVSVSTVKIVDRSWRLVLKADPAYGITTNQKTLPASILLSGQFLSLLLVCIFFLQGRSRNRALELANIITSDLQLERNKAVTQQRKNEAILASIGEGLIVFNHRGEVDLINAAAQRLLGRKEDEVLGRSFDRIVEAQADDGTPVPLEERPSQTVLKTGQTISTTFYYVKKNGDRFPVQLNMAPVLHKNKVMGAIEVFRDITREKEIDKAKTEFVSLASHQLRTPLSTINWYSEMLLAGDAGKITDEQSKYIDEIYKGNQRMVDLVGALLNASRIDLGTFSVEPEPTDLIELCKTIVKDLEPRIFARKMEFVEQYDKTLPIVNVDPKLMRMVIENLAANSVKYTPEKGKIVMAVEHKGSNVLISVKDNGYGIPKKQQEKIFSKLFRADNVKAQDTEGTGLGLYIVKSIVDYSGGKIWFESVENKGTTFYVSLPIHGMKQKKGSKQLD